MLVVVWRKWAALGRVEPRTDSKQGKTRRPGTRRSAPRKPPASRSRKRPETKPADEPVPRTRETRKTPEPTDAPPAVPEPEPEAQPEYVQTPAPEETPEPVVVRELVESPPVVIDQPPSVDTDGPEEPAAPEKPKRRRRGRTADETAELRPVGAEDMNPDRDHVPLQDEPVKTTDLAEPAEPKLAFRHRFRRGLSKTREFLNQDVRDVFSREPGPEDFDRLEEALVAADVGVATASAITDELRKRDDLRANVVLDVLKERMVAQLGTADRRLRLVRNKLSVWIVCGVNGTGKTTTIAKLAARAKALGLKVSLAAADTYRAAAIEQLAEWADRIGVDIVRQAQGADPGAVAFDAIAHAKAEDYDLVIVDTAGRLHTRKPLMDELQKIVRIIGREEQAVLAECLLVIDATTGQNGIAQARAFREAVGVTGLVLAKLDGSAKGGIVFAVERELEVPVKAVGMGEHQNDLVPFDPQAFVDALFGADDEGDLS